jgi:hypothetical protein
MILLANKFRVFKYFLKASCCSISCFSKAALFSEASWSVYTDFYTALQKLFVATTPAALEQLFNTIANLGYL